MIDFKSRSWFEQYLAYRSRQLLELEEMRPLSEAVERQARERFESLRHPLYLCLQHSGMLYGFPIEYPFRDPSGFVAGLSAGWRAKLILLDTIVFTIALEEGYVESPPPPELVAQVGRCLRIYFKQLHYYSNGEAVDHIEQALFERVRYKKGRLDFRKTGIDTHLFWDLYFFREYYREQQQAGFREEDFFPALLRRRKEMKILTLKVLVAAAHADWKIVRQERRLIRQFRRSARSLSAGSRRQIRNLFRMGLSLTDIQFPELDWIARRFLMDVCLLAIFSDSDIDLMEDAFIRELCLRLNLQESDLLSSKAGLGSFLYLHGKALHFYEAKKAGLLLLGHAIIENMAKLGYAARMEAVETREMAVTFSRILASRLPLHKNQGLPTEEEINAAIDQLKDIPRFLPFFSFIFMPVPGITEMYILLALSLERFSGGNISLLPSQLRKIMHQKEEEE